MMDPTAQTLARRLDRIRRADDLEPCYQMVLKLASDAVRRLGRNEQALESGDVFPAQDVRVDVDLPGQKMRLMLLDDEGGELSFVVLDSLTGSSLAEELMRAFDKLEGI